MECATGLPSKLISWCSSRRREGAGYVPATLGPLGRLIEDSKGFHQALVPVVAGRPAAVRRGARAVISAASRHVSVCIGTFFVVFEYLPCLGIDAHLVSRTMTLDVEGVA